jgi:hypothetical protein
MIFPLGFFLGMPFPLGILAIEHQPRGAVAWAWGMNGLFTVIGGLASVFGGVEIGFDYTIIIALVLYGCALAVYRKMRDTVTRGSVAGTENDGTVVKGPSYDATWQTGGAARSSQSQV